MNQETQAFKALPKPDSVSDKHWFRGAVPHHLLEAAPRRLGLLAVVSALVLLSGFVLFFRIDEAFIEGLDSRTISMCAILFSVLLSIVVFVLTKIKSINSTTFIRIGFIWEILFAL